MTTTPYENDRDAIRPPWAAAKGWLKKRLSRSWNLTVVGAAPITPRMRRVSLIGEDLAELDWVPGQDLVLELPVGGGEVAQRYYTIRRFDPAELRLDMDFVLHGHGASARWLEALRPGDRIDALGPRGRTRLAGDVESHLFLGDETCIPAIFAMAETVPRGASATALIEVEDETDMQPLDTPANVTVEWHYRRGAAPADSSLVLDRLQALSPDPYSTHAYVIGETSQVRSLRHDLLARGFDKARITAEGYWRPGRIGGHDHV
ncbi:MAG TPA: siderophore-interacting protein [Caulobacteraceae bacterium]